MLDRDLERCYLLVCVIFTTVTVAFFAITAFAIWGILP